ncbi:MAG: hypothetical protein EHM73_06980 [Chroococcales cyanobacterium metabat2.561]|nr:MAG: hypothetical protein EHM73_06980 [Chroococcales cyanobacterium metabat2.561]
MAEVTANYDKTWKEAISTYLAEFLNFFYPNIYQEIDWNQPPISLNKELEQITAAAETEQRYADKLLKVWLLDNQEIWLLIHIEVQSQYDLKFPQRMFIYNYRAFDLYHKPVISLAILGDESRSWRPDFYQYGLGGSQVRVDFLMVKLLDYQWEDLEQSENIWAIIVMAHLKNKATTNNLREREQWKWNLVRGLYQRGLTKFEIINLGKFIDKMMTFPLQLQLNFKTKLSQYEEENKMPFLSTIEEMALEEGAKSGAELTSQKYIILALQSRFGEIPNSLIETINQIEDVSVLESLFVPSITINSLGEFQQLVNDSLS